MAVKVLTIKEDILVANDVRAKENNDLLEKKNILMINIMSSPGAGKTTLLLKTIEDMKEKTRIGVIEGDVASSVDADKINEQSIPVVQINTAGGCHLDANQVSQGLNNLPLDDIDLLFIENVGNLICTAEFALGEQKKVMILSLPEGHDKPYKYPIMFTEVDVVLVSKNDLAPLLDFNMDEFVSTVKGLNEKTEIFPISAKTGEGIEAWYSWLINQLKGIQDS
ncbi:MAG: hydrogenase nickel incorporation protein HypB [Dehalococcoidales bacterium]|nr:MAG: hydrogenase nickel incorporation protein HypB [Dehalococcoidales bacterium]